MVVLEPVTETYSKPLPEIGGLNAPFLEGLRHHEFLVPKCRDCGDYHWVPYPACRTCLSDALEWTPVSGNAHIYSYTIVHRGLGAFAEEVPYVVVMGELVEQPRPCLVIAQLVGMPRQDIRIGQPIQIGFVDVPAEDSTSYRWVLRE